MALKNLDDACREIDHLTQASNDAFSLQKLNIVERYANHGLRIVLNLCSMQTARQYNLVFKGLRVFDFDHRTRRNKSRNCGTLPMGTV